MIPGLAVKGGLVIALAVTLGGYTVAESATQRAIVADRQAQALADAEAHRAAVEAERERAVATAEDAIADATDVQTVAATTVPQAELVPLVEAVEQLNELLVEVPDAPLPALPGEADADGAAADGTSSEDASGTLPTQIPDTEADTEADPVTDPAADAATGADATETGAAAAGSDDAVQRSLRASRSAAGRAPLADATDAATPDTDSDTDTDTDTDTADPATTTTDAAQAEAAEQVQEGADEDDDGSTDPAAVPGDDTSSGDVADGGLDDATGAPVPADDAQPDDELAGEILAAVARVTEAAAQVQATADAAIAAQQAAAAAAAEAEAQAAAQAAAEAAEKAAQRASLDAYANGRIPAEALCDLPGGGGHQLRCDAADALTALDAAYRAEFGTSLTISDSYRSYAAQVACRRVKGYLCATPGTSNHGRGVAVDLAGGVQTFGTRQHRWMAEHAGEYGWVLPDWARAGGSKPEAWPWEYTG